MARVAMNSTSAILRLEWAIRPAADRVWTEWVDHDRNARVWGTIRAVADGDGAPLSLLHAVTACAQALSAMGAGLAIIGDGGVLEPLLSSDLVAGELEELQFALGEGPGRDAMRTDAPVLETDLAGVSAGHRWPAFAAAGAERGVRGTFAFPVGAGAARVGVLSVYRREAGPLRSGQLADALVFADAVFVLTLDHRHGLSADFDEVIEVAFTARRAEVHQAAGRIAAQQSISVTDAFARLRAHAYSSGLSLHRIATDVMADRLRLESDLNGSAGRNSLRNGQRTSPPEGTSDPNEIGPEHAETEEEEEP